MSCKLQQSLYSGCVTYAKSRIDFNNCNTFNNVQADVKTSKEKTGYINAVVERFYPSVPPENALSPMQDGQLLFVRNLLEQTACTQFPSIFIRDNDQGEPWQQGSRMHHHTSPRRSAVKTSKTPSTTHR